MQAAFERQKCDRIPTDLGGTRKTGITVTALYHLRQCLGTEIPARLYDVYEGVAEMDDLLEETLGCDVLRLPQPVPLLKIDCLKEQTKKWWKPYAMEDGTGVLIPKDFYPERELSGDLCLRDFQDRRFAMMKRNGWRYELLNAGPGAQGLTLEQVERELAEENPSVAFLPGGNYWDLLKSFVTMCAKTSKKALSFRAGPPSPFFGGLGFREPLKWLEILESGSEEAEKLLQKWLQLWLEQIERLATVAANSIDVLILEEDFSGVCQEMDRQLIRNRILPLYAQGIQELRARLGAKARILWQAEGNSTPFLPQLIEMGVDALAFTNLETSGMNPLAIKQEFGKDLVLWGGACSAADLAEKSQDAILQKVQENVAILAENGGYVHALAGNVLPATNPESLLTFFSRRG